MKFNAKLWDDDEIHHIDELEVRLGNIQLSGNGQVVIAGDQPSLTALGQKPREVKASDNSSESKSAEAEKTTEGKAKKLFKDIKGVFGRETDK